jgi:hypothetical protein
MRKAILGLLLLCLVPLVSQSKELDQLEQILVMMGMNELERAEVMEEYNAVADTAQKKQVQQKTMEYIYQSFYYKSVGGEIKKGVVSNMAAFISESSADVRVIIRIVPKTSIQKKIFNFLDKVFAKSVKTIFTFNFGIELTPRSVEDTKMSYEITNYTFGFINKDQISRTDKSKEESDKIFADLEVRSKAAFANVLKTSAGVIYKDNTETNKLIDKACLEVLKLFGALNNVTQKDYNEFQNKYITTLDDCLENQISLDYLIGVKDGVSGKIESILSLEEWINVLKGCASLVYNLKRCGDYQNYLADQDCQAFYNNILYASKKYVKNLGTGTCYDIGKSWGGLMFDVLGYQGLKKLATVGSAQIGKRVIQTASTDGKMAKVAKDAQKVMQGKGKYWRTAIEMRDDVMAWAKVYIQKLPSTRQLEKFNKASAASYKKADGSIETMFGRNGGVLNIQASYPTISAEKGLFLHPELAKRLPENSMWPNTANCAECDAVNQALHNGAKWEDIQIHTIDIRANGTMTDVIQCSDCQNIFKGMYVTSQ